MSKKKVVIIGAGPAGLTCAYELLKKDKKYEVIILEAEKQVGGISKTINYRGNRMDLGGHRFFSKEEKINRIWEEVLPIQGKKSKEDKILNIEKKLKKGGPDPEKKEKVFLIRNRVSTIYYNKKFFDYPISLNIELFRKLGMKTTIESGFSYLKSIVVKKEENNLENFYINRFGKKLYQIFFKSYTKKLWGKSPKELSADWGSQRVKNLSLLKVLKNAIYKKLHVQEKNQETSLIEQFYYPKYGPGQMWEEMSSLIEKKGGKIITNAKVIKIEKKDSKIKSITYIHNKKEKKLAADVFISSTSLKDLVEMTNDIPKKIYDIAHNLPYRDFITVGLVVKKLNIKNETKMKTISNRIPDCWIYIQEKNIKMGRIQVFNNWSYYLVKDPENTISLGLEYFCNENDEMWQMKDQEFINFAIKELVKMNLIDKEDVICSHIERVKKAYPAYFGTYEKIDEVIEYINTLDNFYSIGRNGQHRYNNMDHSMATAIEVVNVLEEKKEKSAIWKVNTEKSYMEEGKRK